MTNDLTTPAAEIVTAAPPALELSAIDTTTLRQMLAEAIGLTETAIRRTATIWMELINRGEDLSQVRFALAPLMPHVAEGKLVPSLVIQMAGQTRALQRMVGLPIETQQALAEGHALSIAKPDGTVARKTVRQMSFPELAAVVKDGRVLTPEEQRARLRVAPPLRRKSTVVEVRLAPDTYNAAGAAAAAAGMALDDYLRRLIVAALPPA